MHHLFLTLLRHNLRKAREEVKVWSKEIKLEYEVYRFVEYNKKVLSRLKEVRRQAKYMRECHKRVLAKGAFLRGD